MPVGPLGPTGPTGLLFATGPTGSSLFGPTGPTTASATGPTGVSGPRGPTGIVGSLGSFTQVTASGGTIKFQSNDGYIALNTVSFYKTVNPGPGVSSILLITSPTRILLSPGSQTGALFCTISPPGPQSGPPDYRGITAYIGRYSNISYLPGQQLTLSCSGIHSPQQFQLIFVQPGMAAVPVTVANIVGLALMEIILVVTNY